MKITWNLWSAATALAVLCGLSTYVLGWAAIIRGAQLWNVPTDIWFLDAVASAAFAIFFFLVYMHSVKK